MVLEVTPHAPVARSVASPAELRFRRLVDRLRGRRRPLIQLQHNPDPDALASALALKHLIKRVLRVEAVLAFTGSVGRAENRAMMRYLKIQIMPAFKVDYARYDFIAVVDTQPGTGTCRLPDGVVADLVVDHHPPTGTMEGVALPFLDPTYGATSTLIGEMLIANGVPIPQRVATALAYGIQTDTLGLARPVSAADERVFAAVYALSDKRLLGRIQRARVPQAYFQALERGLRHASIHDDVVTTHLGAVEHADLVAEVADLLFRLEGMTWAFVTGAHKGTLFASLRASDSEVIDAGEIARKVAGPKGSGGGHETFAAAQIPLAAGESGEAVHEKALERFLSATRAKRSLTRPLTVPPGERGEES